MEPGVKAHLYLKQLYTFKSKVIKFIFLSLNQTKVMTPIKFTLILQRIYRHDNGQCDNLL